jgi:retron-type reverse transcriptase
MADVERHTEDWKTLPWKDMQRNVFRLQQRIHQAERRGDHKQVHNLQRLLLRSWSARCLAVRQVTQDNRGKRTPASSPSMSWTQTSRNALTRLTRRRKMADYGSGWTSGLTITTIIMTLSGVP